MGNIIEVSKIYKTYTIKGTDPLNAVNGLSLSVKEGEFVAIKGVSGSGKSTLLNIIGTLDYPTKGSVKVLGKEITKMRPNQLASFRNDNIGFVLQDFGLIPYSTGYENIEIPLLFTRKKAIGKAAIETVATQLGIGDLLGRKVNTMSGGQKQRVAIARALVNDPKLILADEPTGALDSKSKKIIVDLLRGIADTGKTIVMVTHDENAASVADRIITITDGQIETER